MESPKDEPTSSTDALEVAPEASSEVTAPAPEPSPSRFTIPCPYNAEHLVPLEDFNAHVWKCRSDRMSFYPHSLKLKRCKYNLRHFLPEEELPFHEIFCKSQLADLRNLLATDPIFLDVADFVAAQKLQKQLEANYSDSEDSEDDDDEEGGRKRSKSVTSEVEKSDVEEEDDMEVTMKRLEFLELKKQININ